MSIDALCERLPDYARDIRANLQALADEEVLGGQAKWGCFLACACAVGQGDTLREIEDAARLDEGARTAARAVAAVMAMNNVYYRALSAMANTEYKTLPPRLRMSVISDPGVPAADFELWSLAVSAINGCGMCLDSHEAELRKHAVPPGRIQAALRIAAVVNAVGRVLAAEAARGKG